MVEPASPLQYLSAAPIRRVLSSDALLRRKDLYVLEKTTYDQLQFASKIYPGRHPQRLATIARLFALKSPPVATAKVLELGCSTGANLIAVAANAPRARLIGVDLSSEQVKLGQRWIADLALDNIELRCANILDLEPGFTRFDYIFCHGVFSWVSEEVQEHIFRLIKRSLTPDGVAYVSYNCLPGWYFRQAVRDVLLYSDDVGKPIGERIARGRHVLDVFSRTIGYDRYTSLVLQNELDRVRRESDNYLFHEFLEDENRPYHFSRFMRRAESHGLQYLGDARFGRILSVCAEDLGLPPDALAELKTVAGGVNEAEQYLDFVLSTPFRETLLCHKEVQLRRDVRVDRLRELVFAALIEPVDSRSARAPVTEDLEEYKDPRGTEVMVEGQIQKAALRALASAYPKCLGFDEIVRGVLRELSASEGPQASFARVIADTLCELLRSLMTRNIVEYYVDEPEIAASLPARPDAGALMRAQAASSVPLTNLKHETVECGEFERTLIALLDGSRETDALVEALMPNLREGKLTITEDGEPVRDEILQREYVRKLVSSALDHLLRLGCLRPGRASHAATSAAVHAAVSQLAPAAAPRKGEGEAPGDRIPRFDPRRLFK